jgi:hypothetical protein
MSDYQSLPVLSFLSLEGEETAQAEKPGVLAFPNSQGVDEAEQRQQTQSAKEAAQQAGHQAEMENIAKYGPLDRTSERLLTDEEQVISGLLDNKDVEGLKSMLTTKLDEIGGNPEDYRMLDYYRGLINPDEPESMEFFFKISCMTVKHLNRLKSR